MPDPTQPAVPFAAQAAAVERCLGEEVRMIRKGHHIAALRAALATLRAPAEVEAGDA